MSKLNLKTVETEDPDLTPPSVMWLKLWMADEWHTAYRVVQSVEYQPSTRADVGLHVPVMSVKTVAKFFRGFLPKELEPTKLEWHGGQVMVQDCEDTPDTAALSFWQPEPYTSPVLAIEDSALLRTAVRNTVNYSAMFPDQAPEFKSRLYNVLAHLQMKRRMIPRLNRHIHANDAIILFGELRDYYNRHLFYYCLFFNLV